MAIIFDLDGVLLDTTSGEPRLRAGAVSATETAAHGEWAVVTSKTAEWARMHLVATGCWAPQVIVSGNDVPAGKPSAQLYLAAARQLGVAPAQCLVIEDAPGGIEAGKAAGAVVMAVATTRARELLGAADVIVDDLVAAQDLLENWVEQSNRRRT